MCRVFYGNGVDMRILLVEDDVGLARTLGDLLVCEGYEVSVSATQDYALALLREEVFDLALLDVSLAQGNGFAVCAAARDIAPEVPVIFVTASDDEYSTVAGLDMGAVDYIAKPFRARELLSRVRAALRRSGAAVSVLKLGDVSIDISSAQVTKDGVEAKPFRARELLSRVRAALRRSGAAVSVLKLGDVSIDISSAQVTKDGVEVYLSALEYRLLLHFAQNAGMLVTRDALRDAIWDTAGEYVSDNSLNVYIKRLREKIEDDPARPVLITTVRGLGYKVGV